MVDKLIKFLEDFSISAIISGVGAIFLLASSILGWYNDQLTVPSSGYMIPVLENSLGRPGHILISFKNLTVSVPEMSGDLTRPGLVELLGAVPCLSFGSLALMLGLLGGLTIFRLFHFLRIPVGIAALLLGITFVVKLACFHSSLLEPLIDTNDQHARLIVFSMVALPPNNLAYEPTFVPGFKTDYLLDRFDAAFYFLSWGWYLLIAGGVLLVGTGLSRGSRFEDQGSLSSIFYLLSLVFLLLLLYSSGLLIPYLLAEYRQIKGDDKMAQGKYDQALVEYLSAQDLNDQLFYHKLFRENLGRIYYKLGRADKPEYYLYQGELLSREGKTLQTLAAYQQALEMSPNDPVIKRLLVSLYLQQGLDYFNAGHNMYSAIQSWKAALEIHPNHLLAHFYMGKAYFDAGNYEQSILENQTFIAQSTNSMLKANAYSNLGDCYVRLEQPKEAREAYLKSRSLDRTLNNRMTDGLAGGI